MCGIAGIISKAGVQLQQLKQMTDAIAHRGPDGDRQWINEEAKVGLGHRRLSIIDLTECGSQPMQVGDRYVIVFNGEIYNFIELKEALVKKGYQFQSATDTEVLVQMYDAYGEDCLAQLDGMFAFVIYDRKEDKIFGARDRFGEKPFFFHTDGQHTFYFASEIKAIWAAGIPIQVDEAFLFNYLNYGYLADPHDLQRTFYSNIKKLPASSCFTYIPATGSLTIKKYWSIDPFQIDYNISETIAQEQLVHLLTTSVNRRLRADVPIGSSLSGGLDSSLIVTILDVIDKDKSLKRKTFSASFPGFKKDETKYQQMVIDRTSVEPHFVYPNEQNFIDNFEKIRFHQDEPFGSASINIQYEVFRKAKEEQITVLLDGQGADEIFAGYHGYFYAYFDEMKSRSRKKHSSELASYQMLHHDNQINELIRPGNLEGIRRIIPDAWKHYYRHRFVKVPMARKVFSADFVASQQKNIFKLKENFNSLNEALHYSLFSFGLEELLRYADRNSMAHSREVRLPFLSHKLVEFVFTLPAEFKIKEGWTKWILRRSFEDKLDQRIVWRKDKIGYEPPQKSWMESQLVQDMVRQSFTKLSQSGRLNNISGYNALGDEMKWRLLNTVTIL
jgi:asparagine synthase (glutamine-hydrolysing)